MKKQPIELNPAEQETFETLIRNGRQRGKTWQQSLAAQEAYSRSCVYLLKSLDE